MGKRDKQTEQVARQEAKINTSQRTTKKRRERVKACVQRQLALAKKPARKQTVKISMNKMSTKKKENKQTTHNQKEQTRIYVYINTSTKKHSKQSPNKPPTAKTPPPATLPTNKKNKKT